MEEADASVAPRASWWEDDGPVVENGGRRPLSLDQIADDYSLPSPGIRFRAAGGGGMIIYDQPHGQMILEERKGRKFPRRGGYDGGGGGGGILVKTTNDKTYAFSFLRSVYTLMATFVGGFVFIMGLAILLYLFIDLATTLGLTSSSNEKMKVDDFVAVLLSVPVFIYSLAMAMTLVVRFVRDTFNGNPFLRSFGLGGIVTTGWIAFALYLGIPVLTAIVTLFLKRDDWWEVSLLTWFACVLAFWCLFSACVLWLEVWAFLQILEEEDSSSIDDAPWGGRMKYWLKKAGGGIVRTMRYRLSGVKIEFRKMDASGFDAASEEGGCFDLCCEDLWCGGFYSVVANNLGNPCFTHKASSFRVQTLEETLGTESYVTRGSWGLETFFCRTGGLNSAIPVTQGESSITLSQIDSTIVCNIMGWVMIGLLILGAAVWFGASAAVLGVLASLLLLFFVWLGFATRRLIGLREDVRNDQDTIYRYWARYHRSTPKDGLVRTVLFAQITLLYLWPLTYLCANGSHTAPLFAFLGICSALRHYMNPHIALLENRGKDYFRDVPDVKTREDRKVWNRKARLFDLIEIGSDSARNFWALTYLLFTLVYIALVMLARRDPYQVGGQDTAPSKPQDPITLVNTYEYPAQPKLHYPTCELKKGFDGHDLQLQDFTFLSKLAYYEDGDSTDEALELWFGRGVAMNNDTVVKEFKNEFKDSYGSAVSYKLISIPGLSGAALTIRGTQTPWDALADAQLWMSATLFQGLRFVLPFSGLWTPILHHMVWMVSKLESDSLGRVAFYHETRGFINYLKKKNEDLKLAVTGHSLGGGLAIITGAQAGVSAVAISGPNAMLSRDSFDPVITVEQLNTLSFNVIPARDPVPTFDDKARLYQNINCTSRASDIIGCHDVSRSICEIQHACGSAERPVLCECVLDFGYPEPEMKKTDEAAVRTNPTFVKACVDSCLSAKGSSEKHKKKCKKWSDMIEKNVYKEQV